MKQATKKHLWSGALMVPVLSLTLLGPAQEAAQAESRNFFDKILAGNRTQKIAAEKQITATPVATLDPRVMQLEEALRDLTRQVETLNSGLLQMQNRIDVLEGRAPSNPALLSPALPAADAPTTASGTPQAAEGQASEEMVLRLPASIRFDGDGNPLDDETLAQTDDADLPQTDDAKEFYRAGYQHMLAGDYRMAERVFRAFQARFPDDEQLGDASFWLGEALYGQGRYREAAQVYIDVQRLHQDSPRSPENLLKLGMSMAQLNETDVACKTLGEVPKRYEQAEPAVLRRVSDEKKRLRCP